MDIREYRETDWPGVWEILSAVFEEGETFPNKVDTSEEEARYYWVEKPVGTFVAINSGKVIGSYHLKDNQEGLGSHVANAGYVVSPFSRGAGVGLKLAAHSLNYAVELGYQAMQFNLVVSTNLPSLRLWQKLGFQTVGTLPNAFNHRKKGLVDAYVLYKWLL